MRSPYAKRSWIDTSGNWFVMRSVPSWKPTATLEELGTTWRGAAKGTIQKMDRILAERPNLSAKDEVSLLWTKASMLNSEGEAKKAYEAMVKSRSCITTDELVSQH